MIIIYPSLTYFSQYRSIGIIVVIFMSSILLSLSTDRGVPRQGCCKLQFSVGQLSVLPPAIPIHAHPSSFEFLHGPAQPFVICKLGVAFLVTVKLHPPLVGFEVKSSTSLASGAPLSPQDVVSSKSHVLAFLMMTSIPALSDHWPV